MKVYLNKLVTIEFSDIKDSYSGFLLDFNEDWVLLRNNPVDYVIDGFVILRNKNIKHIIYDENSQFNEKVIRLKKIKFTNDSIIPLSSLENILSYLTNKYGIFQVATKRSSSVYLGRLSEIDENEFFIDFLNINGVFDGEISFKNKKIRVIEFETDYINSLKTYSDSLLF
ncbi:hypothetical protein [Flavobacterium sp. N2270]|uniref:hypothetical protein n=1 Tax=Flavobacterium sp. N2270 TaxID=2986831 RepID=UPI0022245B4F|nr:hypothetical protein [Flavobacterium sp. N2270]